MSSIYIDVLRSEFDAADGSFLIQLRELHWDKVAFARLVAAMEECCIALNGVDTVDRWVAEGFWFLSWYVRSWSTHENFPREFSEDYYERAYGLLSDLAFFFFVGEHPYIDKRLRQPEP